MTVHTAFGTIAPTLLPIGATVEMEVSSISTVAPVGSSVGVLYQKLYTVKNCSSGWANLSPETCKAELKRIIQRLINEKVVASCWLLTSLYL